MAGSWTIEREIMAMTRLDDINLAMRACGMLTRGEFCKEIVTWRDWHRGGEETYVLFFRALGTLGSLHNCVVKSCVVFEGIPLDESFTKWLRRRNEIADLGVSTPRMYGSTAATLIEEYIPFSVAEALEAGDRSAMLDQIARTAALLVRAGFVPLACNDWRSRGDDVVLIDFGQDIGDSRADVLDGGIISEVLDNFLRAGIRLSEDDLCHLGTAYERFREGSPMRDD